MIRLLKPCLIPTLCLFLTVGLFAVACGGSSSNQPAPAAGGGEPGAAGAGQQDKASAPAPAPTPAPAPAAMTADEAEKVFKEFLGLISSAADQVAAAGTECPKISAALNTWVDTNKAKAKATFDKLPQVLKHKPVVDKHSGEMQRLQARFGTLVAACESDPETKKAAKRFLDSLQGK